MYTVMLFLNVNIMYLHLLLKQWSTFRMYMHLRVSYSDRAYVMLTRVIDFSVLLNNNITSRYMCAVIKRKILEFDPVISMSITYTTNITY